MTVLYPNPCCNEVCYKGKFCTASCVIYITEKLKKQRLAEDEKLREQERLKKLRNDEKKRREGVNYLPFTVHS